MTPATTSALVLGGGGVTGIAWMTGLLEALERAGLALRCADRLIGTSAGAAVAAQIAGETTLAELVRRQRDGDVAELRGSVGRAGMLRLTASRIPLGDRTAAMRRLGRAAASATADPARAAARLDVISARLAGQDWTDRDLRLVAIDVDSGIPRVLTASDGVTLRDAVAASCAVPFAWPAVRIDGRSYMDGGMMSTTNAHVAAGCGRVVVLAPMPGAIQAELDALGPDLRAVVVAPDAEARAAMGRDALDPENRARAADAGQAQADRVAASVAEVWHQTSSSATDV